MLELTVNYVLQVNTPKVAIVANFARLVNFHQLPELLLVLFATVVLHLISPRPLVNTVLKDNSLLKEELVKSAL